jgi:hypothetical protein
MFAHRPRSISLYFPIFYFIRLLNNNKLQKTQVERVETWRNPVLKIYSYVLNTPFYILIFNIVLLEDFSTWCTQ